MSCYLSQLAVLRLITKNLANPELKRFLKLYCHINDTTNDQDIDTDANYDIQCNREGPALNICITKKNRDLEIACIQNISQEPVKILDADFTLALQCPKFPRDGKCKYYINKFCQIVW